MKLNANSTITRRDVLKRVVVGSLAVATSAPLVAAETSLKSSLVEVAEFIPENDYPYFGWHPDTLSPFSKTEN